MGILRQGSTESQSAGPYNIGGRISDVELSPTSFDTIYAGSASGGIFRSLDAGLKFTIDPVKAQDQGDEAGEHAQTTDLRGVGCPLNFVKAKLALEKIEVGAILDVLLDGGDPVRNVPASFTDQGQEVLEVKEAGDHFLVRVRRKK